MKLIVRGCCIFAALACLVLANCRVNADVLASETDYSLLTKGSEEDRNLLKKLNELLEKANQNRDVVKNWLNEYAKQERKTYARVVNLYSKFEKSEQKRLAQDLKKGELSDAFSDRVDAQNLLINFQRLESERNYLEKIRTLHDRLAVKILEAESMRETIAKRMISEVQADNLREKERDVDELSKFLDETQKKLDVWKENDRKQKESLIDSIVKDSKNRSKVKRSQDERSEAENSSPNDEEQSDKEDVDEENPEESSSESSSESTKSDEEKSEESNSDLTEGEESVLLEQEKIAFPDLTEPEGVQEEVDEDQKQESPKEEGENNWTGVLQIVDKDADVPSKPKNIIRGVDLELASKQSVPKAEVKSLVLQTKDNSVQRRIFSVQNVEFAFKYCPNDDQGVDEGFWIQETETTQEQWFVLGLRTTRPCGFKGAKLPVENVDWNACVAFVKRLNERNVAPEGWRFAIPTEAQWERAWKLGKNDLDATALTERAWFGENSDKRTREVGTKKPDALGLYDMSGNVWEWTAPINTADQARVVRGASWNNLPQNGALVERFSCNAQTCGNNLGLRLVLVRNKQTENVPAKILR